MTLNSIPCCRIQQILRLLLRMAVDERETMKRSAILLFIFCIFWVVGTQRIFGADKKNFPHQDFPFHVKDVVGLYFFWQLQYGHYCVTPGVEPMDADFKNYPNIYFDLTKDEKLAATIRGLEKVKKINSDGYYCVSVENLVIVPHWDYADISFEV